MSEGECGSDRAPPESLRRALIVLAKKDLPERLSRGVPQTHFQSASADFRCDHKVTLHDGNWKSLCCDGIPFLEAQSALFEKAGGRQANQIRSAASLDSDVNHAALRRHAREVDNLYDFAFQRLQVDDPVGGAAFLPLGASL